MKEVLDFLYRLHDNNEKEWFDTHRAEWKRVQGQFNAFAEQLLAGVGEFDASVRGLQLKECVYRINRDTRFSKDKSPYKTHVSVYIAPKGKNGGYGGYYFHIEPQGDGLIGSSMLSGGIYCPEPVVLRSIREEILDNGAQIAAAVQTSGFTLCDHKLKRTPQGFPSGTEWDEMLKLKDVYVQKMLPEEFILADNLLERTLAEFRRTQPFVALVNRAVQYAYDEMM